MHRLYRLRHPLAALVLAAALLAPPPVRADDAPPPADGSPAGVVFAMLCGASISINRMAPGIPVVFTVGAFSCFAMLVDAMATRD